MSEYIVKKKVGPYQPIEYAGASLDFNPIHIDPEVGKLAGMGGTILHGMCTMAFVAEAAVKLVGDPGKLKHLKTRFSKPVKPGDEICISVKNQERGTDETRVTFIVESGEGQSVIKDAIATVDNT